jgi:hypothetical protein
VATDANWTSRTSISITVEPAMPAWVPWSIILAFLLLLVSPILIKTQRAKARRRTSHKRRKLRFRGIYQRTWSDCLLQVVEVQTDATQGSMKRIQAISVCE